MNRPGVCTPRWTGYQRQRRTAFRRATQHKDIRHARTNNTLSITTFTLCLSKAFYLYHAALTVQAGSLEAGWGAGTKKEHGEHWAGTEAPAVSWAPPPHFPPPTSPSCREPLRRRGASDCPDDKTKKKTATVWLGTHLQPYHPKEKRTWLLWVWYCCFCTLGRLSPDDKIRKPFF